MSTTIVPEYTPGEWVAVVTPGGVALLPAGTPAATVQRLWASMRATASVQAASVQATSVQATSVRATSVHGTDAPSLVDHLQVLAAGDLTAMPPFALVTIAGARLHAVVRGAVRVEVTVAGHPRVLTAPHVSTWSEEVVEGVERVEVRAPGDAGPDRDGHGAEALPVVSGVVRAGAVRVPVQPTVEPQPGVEPEPTSEPTTEHEVGHEVEHEPERGSADADDEVWAPVPADLLASALVPAQAVVAARSAPWSAAARRVARHTGGSVPAHGHTHAPVGAGVPTPSGAVDPLLADRPVDITLLRPTPSVPQPAPAEPAPVDSAVHAPTDVSAAAADVSAADISTDHDGTTVLGHEVLALRRQLPEWTGHAVVGSLVVPAPPTPAPARIALSTGDVVSLSRPVLLGRAPQASRVAGSQVPRLVTVPSPLQDISRTHAEVRMDGDDVVLTDLRSTNGVLVVQPAGTPQRLQPGEATVLQPGVLVDLGEGVTFTVERGA